jgi:transglutaminase/protease-like cytokinesis protein 3
MKRFLLIFTLIFPFSLSIANDYSQIDPQAKTVPFKLKTAPDIAHYLTKNLSNPTDKARAIYIWIASNIRYDLSMINHPKPYHNTQELVDEVLARRQGVCQNYAELFQACCTAVGLKSYVIVGYTRDSLGKVNPLGHAWNAIEIDNHYTLMDVTWAAGYVQNGTYVHRFRDLFFMRLPSDFIHTHIPFDPIWQFSNSPILHANFIKGDFSTTNPALKYNYKDSIGAMEKMNRIEKRQHENSRIFQAGLSNKLIKDRFESNSQFIKNEQLNIKKEKFNQASLQFSKGIDDYNAYITLLNQNKGNSSKMEPHLHLLNTARSQILSAVEMVENISTGDAGLQQNSKEMIAVSKKIIPTIQDLLEKAKK